MIKPKNELSQISNYTPGKPIEEVKRELGIRGKIIKLASNENPLGPSPKAVEALKKSIKEIHLYPDDTAYYLKKRLSEKLSVPSGQILLGNGSVELINNALFCYSRKGDSLVRSEYAFIMSSISAMMNGLAVKNIKMKEFRHDVDSLLKACQSEKSRILYVDNPTNPVGSMLSEDEVKYLLKKLGGEKLLILDEAYNEYLDSSLRVDSAKLIKKHKNLLVLRTFSKIYGLAGLRIGYAIADSGIIDTLAKVRLPFNTNLPAQKAALAAVDDDAHLLKSKAVNDEGKEYICSSLKKLNYEYVESFTNFVMFNAEKQGSEISEKLQRKGVIVRPLHNYGLHNYLRVTIGSMSENRKFIKSMKEVGK